MRRRNTNESRWKWKYKLLWINNIQYVVKASVEQIFLTIPYYCFIFSHFKLILSFICKYVSKNTSLMMR